MKYWFIYDPNGVLYYQPQLSATNPWPNPPATLTVISYPKYTAPVEVVMAYTYPNYYEVQSGAIVAKTNIATLQLSDTQNDKIAELNNAFNQAFSNGFPSSATGAQVTFGCAPADMQNMSDELNSVNAGIAVYPIPWKALGGTPTVSFATAAEFKQLCQDFYTYKWAQINNLDAKIAAVQAATTVDAVIAVTW